ncbi:MAG TPA: NmrA/HSCARG family protein [Thermoplasmata archaeon]|nr:NmrA/HSCARG family protein [Thermoplasmata archaeon]
MPHSKELEGRSSEPKRVLVTGATGQQGGGLARLLLKRGHHVRALTRKPDSAAAGELRKLRAEVVAGDLGDPESVARAAKGVDVAYLVATPYEQGSAAETRFGKTGLDGMRVAGVPYIVYSSVSDADRKTGIPHFDSKAEVEEHLKGLGTDYSIIAPVFFMENFFAPWITAGFGKGVFATGIVADRKLQIISLPEISEFTTLAVEQPRSFRGKRINIASDQLTPLEMARQISEVARTKLTYQTIPLDQVRQQSEDFAKMYDWFNRVGYSADIAKLKTDYPQVHWRTFREWSRIQNWSRVLPASTKA